VNPIKVLLGTANGVAYVDGSAVWYTRSADRNPVRQVGRCLQHIIAAGRTGKNKSEIRFTCD